MTAYSAVYVDKVGIVRDDERHGRIVGQIDRTSRRTLPWTVIVFGAQAGRTATRREAVALAIREADAGIVEWRAKVDPSGRPDQVAR